MVGGYCLSLQLIKACVRRPSILEEPSLEDSQGFIAGIDYGYDDSNVQLDQMSGCTQHVTALESDDTRLLFRYRN